MEPPDRNLIISESALTGNCRSYVNECFAIVGIDVGSETHFARAFDWRNYEYSKKPLEFSNTESGFATFKAWMEDIAEKYGKDKVIATVMADRAERYFSVGLL